MLKAVRKAISSTSLTPTRKTLLIFLTGVVTVLLVLDLLFPLPDPQHSGEGYTQVVTDRHQLVLRAFPDDRGVWRYPVTHPLTA
ncbi:hypothetical protein, partial [uncultured Thalassolituus sp.]